MSKLSPSLDTDDALNPKFNASALDLLLLELVPLAQRITEQIQAREKALMDEYKRSKVFTQPSTTQDQSRSAQANGDGEVAATDGSIKTNGADSTSDITSLGFSAVEEQVREGIFWRLDGLGYRVGQGLVERYIRPEGIKTHSMPY